MKRGERGERARNFLNGHVSLVRNLIIYILSSSYPLNLLDGRSSFFIWSETSHSQLPFLAKDAPQSGFEPSRIHCAWAGIIISNYRKSFSLCSWFRKVNIKNLPNIQTFFLRRFNILQNIYGKLIFTQVRYAYC